jgi:hypothetical protein
MECIRRVATVVAAVAVVGGAVVGGAVGFGVGFGAARGAAGDGTPALVTASGTPNAELDGDHYDAAANRAW